MRLDPETGIWSARLARKNHKHDEGLASEILKFFHPKKFADVGCGDGWYCSKFKEAGWPIVHGYDGTFGVSKLGIYKDIMTVDLTKERYVGIDYDLVMCLEVGEHIPEKFETIFIENLVRYCSRYLILSWAPPGQKGSGHVNCRDYKYVMQKMLKYGFELHEELTIRLQVAADLPWLKKNTRAYEKAS